MNQIYKIPAQAPIGYIHLKASDFGRLLDFCCDLLGFQITTACITKAAFFSAGNYHYPIGLNTLQSRGEKLFPLINTGFYHFLILLFPERIWQLFTINHKRFNTKYMKQFIRLLPKRFPWMTPDKIAHY